MNFRTRNDFSLKDPGTVVTVIVMAIILVILVNVLATSAAGLRVSTSIDTAIGILEGAGFTVFAAGETPTDTPTFLVCSSTAQANSCDFTADGTDDHVQIQQAINDCPANSCRVVLTEGIFDIGQPVAISSNVTLLTLGTLRLSDGADSEVLTNSDRVVGNSGIRIIGGVIDGNRANQTPAQVFTFGVRFERVDNFLIRDLRIFDTERDGINVRTSTHGNIENIDLTNTGNHSVLVGFASKYINITNITSNAPGTEHVLTEWDADSQHTEANEHITISNVVGRDAGNHGVAVFDARQVTVENCSIFNSSSAGLNINGASEVAVSNCTVDTSINVVAVNTTNARRVVLNNIISRNSGQGASAAFNLTGEEITLSNSIGMTASRPIVATASTRNLVVQGNTFFDIGSTEIFLTSSFNGVTLQGNSWVEQSAQPNRLVFVFDDAEGVRIIDNNMDQPTTAQKIVFQTSVAKDKAEVRGNRGFVQENSGSATLSNGTTSVTVAHGLSLTPDIGEIQVTPRDDMGAASTFWISAPTTTGFDINVDVDPGVAINFSWRASVLLQP